MATTRRAPAARPTTSHNAENDARVSALFAGCGLALVVARFVVPAESAHLGETLWIAELWLLLAAGWMLLRLRGLASRIEFDGGDLAVALLVAGQCIASVVVLVSGGHRRAALNMLWEWVAVGVAVVLVRQWLTQSVRWPLLWRVIATAGIVLSGLGVWQFAVIYPGYRAQIEELTQLEIRHADGTLSEADARRFQQLRSELGTLATETDSNVRFALRQRLMASTEPLACFALANTLAGVLAVALLLLLGGLAGSLADHAGAARVLRIAVPAALVAGCLVLTKSRTAWIGLLCGLAVWWIVAARGKWLSPRGMRIVLIGLLMLAVLGGVALAAGALDRLVVLESGKSLRYRIEYWTGAWGVIRDHLWLGAGPGNFRQNYLRHKVAGSSEEVLDPHNLFLDVWANGGLIALVGLVLAGGWAVRRWKLIVAVPTADQAMRKSAERLDAVAIGRAAILCGVGGIGLVLLKFGLVDLHWDARLASLLAGWVVTALVVSPLRISAASQVASGVALGVHLLGAGGIAMPVIAITLLLLWLGPARQSAVVAPATDAGAVAFRRRAFAGLMLLAVLAPACLFSSVIPVTLSSVYVAAATSAISERGDVATARRYLNKAIQADVLDPQPWVYLAQLERDEVNHKQGATAQDWLNAMIKLSPAIALDPENSKTYWLDAQWKLEFAGQFPSAEASQEALEAARQAAVRDPQHAGIAATLAEAYAAADQPAEAHNAAERALGLDALNQKLGHLDKLLGAETRDKLHRLAGE